jgi:hypothetical protein
MDSAWLYTAAERAECTHLTESAFTLMPRSALGLSHISWRTSVAHHPTEDTAALRRRRWRTASLDFIPDAARPRGGVQW